MTQWVKRTIKKTRLYHRWSDWMVRRRQVEELVAWERSGKPVPPPPIVKQRTLRSYSRGFGLRVLVETGTYVGDMVEAMKHDFDHIYSIELSKELYEAARERFRGETHIELVCGDSGAELAGIVSKLHEPALFWLDGHYSAGVTARGDKDTPIWEELGLVLGAAGIGHVIVVDDARCFGSDPQYPSIQEVRDFVSSKRPEMNVVVQDDSIRIAPRR